MRFLLGVFLAAPCIFPSRLASVNDRSFSAAGPPSALKQSTSARSLCLVSDNIPLFETGPEDSEGARTEALRAPSIEARRVDAGVELLG